MTKLEAWQAWCAKTGTERLALESTMNQSSHGKAFSFAWDAAVKAEREECAKAVQVMALANPGMMYMTADQCANIIRSRT